jgi:Kef-type K+ transport system membrane component KefB/mannitol/fructose-specific phosphotransferase system IIA component (Ntr-type)
MKKLSSILFLIFFISIGLFASDSSHSVEEADILHKMTMLVFQLGIIIFASKFVGRIFGKIHLPTVLGELISGIIIGPYFLGSVPILNFNHGLFPLIANSTIPVTTELYGVAIIASIILLFHAGLETDLNLFMRYSLKGAIVGVSGVIFSFLAGVGCSMFLLHRPFMDPVSLFLGVLSIATSVGITAKILSEKRKMDSPEGVTILAAAVIDDVLGIIILAIVMGIVGVLTGGGDHIEWGAIGIIAFKAIVVWLGFTVLGLIFASKISLFLKLFRDKINIAIAALALALIFAGIFESAGLALIIGAYVLGLSLSKTDISFVIQDVIHPIGEFIIPVFFSVMGMMVNLNILFSKEVLFIGIIYAFFAIISKIIGCGIPSLFLNFNLLGATRIGVGMVPRGEVALIIGGIGVSTGILDSQLFGIAVLMTLITTIIPPPLLSKLLAFNKPGTRKETKGTDTISTVFEFPSPDLTDLAVSKIVNTLDGEGFFSHKMDIDGEKIYQLRRDKIFFTIFHQKTRIEFVSDKEDKVYVKTIAYEAFLDLNETIKKLQDMANPEDMQRDILNNEGESRSNANLMKMAINSNSIILDLKSTKKEDIIKELVELLFTNGQISDKDEVLKAVLDREKIMSTGSSEWDCLPHCKTDSVDSIKTAIALAKNGVDFESLDGLPAKVIVLIVSPLSNPGPHIQFLSAIGSVLNDHHTMLNLLDCKTTKGVRDEIISKA